MKYTDSFEKSYVHDIYHVTLRNNYYFGRFAVFSSSIHLPSLLDRETNPRR